MKAITERFWGYKLRSLDAIDFDSVPTFIEADGILTDISTFNGICEANRLYVFKSISGKAVDYDVYYNKVQVHLHSTPTDRSVEIFIAKENGSWAPTVGDASSSKVEKFRIYVWDKRLFMTDAFHSDSRYISGSWNKYVYKQLKEILVIFENSQESVDYDKIYSEKTTSYEG